MRLAQRDGLAQRCGAVRRRAVGSSPCRAGQILSCRRIPVAWSAGSAVPGRRFWRTVSSHGLHGSVRGSCRTGLARADSIPRRLVRPRAGSASGHARMCRRRRAMGVSRYETPAPFYPHLRIAHHWVASREWLYRQLGEWYRGSLPESWTVAPSVGTGTTCATPGRMRSFIASS